MLHQIDLLFQFHKGAIGVNNYSSYLAFHTIFQFHKGAIGVQRRQMTGEGDTKFQFHKGAIGVPSIINNQTRLIPISIP